MISAARMHDFNKKRCFLPSVRSFKNTPFRCCKDASIKKMYFFRCRRGAYIKKIYFFRCRRGAYIKKIYFFVVAGVHTSRKCIFFVAVRVHTSRKCIFFVAARVHTSRKCIFPLSQGCIHQENVFFRCRRGAYIEKMYFLALKYFSQRARMAHFHGIIPF